MEDTETLRKVFVRCEEVITSLESENISVEKSKEIQSCLEDITRNVSVLGLFSENENIDELPTSSIRFLLLPAYLGILKINSKAKERLGEIEAAEIYFKDFLKRAKNYGALSREVANRIDEAAESDSFMMPESNSNPQEIRQKKIQRFKDQKLLQEKIRELESRRQISSTFDDEDIRTLYLTRIKYWGQQTLDELSSIQEEKAILKHMEGLRIGSDSGDPGPSSSKSEASTLRESAPKLKPIILTRTQMQKEVFGLGYPSLPTMTIEEWFDNFYGPQNEVSQASTSEQSGAAGEDTESDEAVMKAREMDEYKDTHRRGWGNTYNKG